MTKNSVLQLRITDNQKDRWQRLAAAEHRTLTDWITQTLELAYVAAIDRIDSRPPSRPSSTSRTTDHSGTRPRRVPRQLRPPPASRPPEFQPPDASPDNAPATRPTGPPSTSYQTT